MGSQLASLDLTHVLCECQRNPLRTLSDVFADDANSHLSFGLALLTLSPILLMASYASLAVFTRELTVLIMWAGQLLCEASNYLLKHWLKQPRPNGQSDGHLHIVILTALLSARAAALGDGYGFPSSHSQWMAYFATFLICHVGFRHRFTPTGSGLVDFLLRLVVILGLITWAGGVAYSRCALSLVGYDPAVKADCLHLSGSA